MSFRSNRWLAAVGLAVVAFAVTPDRAVAGVQILIEEVDTGGAVIPGTSRFFTGTSVLGYSTQNFFDINVTVNTTSGVLNAVNSLTTPVGMKPVTNFNAGRQLRVIVTDDGYLNLYPGLNATVENNAGASSGISGGQNAVTAQTQLLQLPLNPGTNQTANLATGTPLGSPTDPATDIRPSSNPSPTTFRDIPSLPGQFAIQQTIYIRAINVSPGGIADGSTLGGTASSVVLSFTPAVVPAPGGLVLALVALPVIGLRLVMRRRTAA